MKTKSILVRMSATQFKRVQAAAERWKGTSTTYRSTNDFMTMALLDATEKELNTKEPEHAKRKHTPHSSGGETTDKEHIS